MPPMNRSDYKRLGDYIEPVDERNTNGEIKLSQGISNNKYFQTPKQVATDSTKDNIVRKGYFAYNRATTRNGEKISIAYREGEDCTVSGAYQVFRIKDESLLHPVYLWMWFRRPEFDRYARFKSHGSAHEFFEFDEMCEVMLPVPSIERQRAMVAEYETLSRRIDLNRSMIAQLEATAQTLYRKMFVDDIDPEHLPAGWRMGTLGEIADFAYGKMPDKSISGDIPIYSGYGIVGYTNMCMYDKQHIIVIARGDAGSGKIVLSPHKFFLTNLSIAILLKDNELKNYLYYCLLNSDTSSLRSGSAQAQVTINSLQMFEIIIPNFDFCYRFGNYIEPINKQKQILLTENINLTELQSLLLAKMGQ